MTDVGVLTTASRWGNGVAVTPLSGTGRSTAHDWEEEKNRAKDFFDDGTMTFFWNAHTCLCLFVFSCFLFYVAVLETDTFSSEYNLKRGLCAVFLVFVLFGVLHTPDGPFRRPHPAFWRLVLCLSICYELLLVLVLFQAKMDLFVLVHFFGWWFKTLIVRDYWLCNVLSFAFEVMEYTLEHQLPNFHECWWDHWIMDFLVCNMAGIWLGMKTLNYLSIKPYHWRDLRNSAIGLWSTTWWQHDSAPAHDAQTVRDYLSGIFGHRWIVRDGSTELDFFFWGYLKRRVYVTNPN
ncbi:unnamed protein product [Dicrocoelium dendriticum]|nr:unnamed protein product [Dicrocoelium dendriticum]